ncbi:MAG: hypothetical protein QNJ11_19205 [Woeseiaceae bacterium]|nr:hypothetical protein [Woeseiaceae bacterium]
MSMREPGAKRHRLPESDDAISREPVGARMTATAVSAFPGALPDTMAQAYAIQAASTGWLDAVAGWKVGLLPQSAPKRHLSERLADPIFGSRILDVATGSSTVMPVYIGGFAAVEAEFIFRLGKSVRPVDRQWTEEELVDVVAGLHVGAEIASSPTAEINSVGPTVVVSDFGNKAGLLLGPEIPDWQTKRPEDIPAGTVVDGEIIGEASAAAIQDGPIGALRLNLALSAARGLELPAGSLDSTGASWGIHDVEMTSTSRLEFGEYGSFEVTYEPMLGWQ